MSPGMSILASLATIAVVHWAVLIVPGFNVALLGQLAASQGRATALAAVAGMVSATFLWASLAVAGVGAVFSAHPALRQVVQVAGGLYLVSLAIRMWRSGAPSAPEPPGPMRHAAAFRVGLVASLLNPKIALFYGSVFATALPPAPSALHIAGAIALVCLNSLAWHVGVTLVLSHKAIQAAYLRHLAFLTRASAGVLSLFGLRLIVDTLRELRERGI